MKKLFTVFLTLITSVLLVQSTLAFVRIRITGYQAKRIYHKMTGSAVDNQGAAGHLYRQGKSILCRYIDVDMDDSHGHPLQLNDARRYACTMRFDKNGLASPDNQ